MLPHGPNTDAFEHASSMELKPQRQSETMAFMFETRFAQRLTKFAAEHASLQADYVDCWKDIHKRFDPKRR